MTLDCRIDLTGFFVSSLVVSSLLMFALVGVMVSMVAAVFLVKGHENRFC